VRRRSRCDPESRAHLPLRGSDRIASGTGPVLHPSGGVTGAALVDIRHCNGTIVPAIVAHFTCAAAFRRNEGVTNPGGGSATRAAVPVVVLAGEEPLEMVAQLIGRGQVHGRGDAATGALLDHRVVLLLQGGDHRPDLLVGGECAGQGGGGGVGE